MSAASPGAYAATTLLAWLKRHQPARYAKIGHVLFCKDWIRYRLTGVVATDPADASTAFTDANTQAYVDEVLAGLDLPEVAGARSTILPSGAVIGPVSAAAAVETGLHQGTPVSGGMHDVTACAAGLGNREHGIPSITAGTFNINGTL